MKAGYFNVQLTKDGMPIKNWVEDSRKVFIGAVQALKAILTPEISQKEFSEIKRRMDEYDIIKKNLFEKYCYKERIKQVKNGMLVWIESGRKMIPEIDDFVVIPNPARANGALEGKGGWNTYVNAYWNEMVDLHDEVFSVLNQLINDLNYFKQKVQW